MHRHSAYQTTNINSLTYLRSDLDRHLDILLDVCHAVAFAHSKGVMHRDLKPSNVMVGNFGEVYVMDWGLAALLPAHERPADAETIRHKVMPLHGHAIGGTAAYMAPEMAAGQARRIGTASDIYLLGAILYEIVTGKRPHTGESTIDTILNASKNIITPSDHSSELKEIALKAMATNIPDRHPTVAAFQQAIRDSRQHAESNLLTERASHALPMAIEQQEYDRFNNILYMLSEAIELWPDNNSAAKLKRSTSLALAEAALHKGDVEYCLEIIHSAGLEDATITQQAEQAIAEQQRREKRAKQFRWVAAVLLVSLMGLGTYAIAEHFKLFGNWETVSAGSFATQSISDDIIFLDGNLDQEVPAPFTEDNLGNFLELSEGTWVWFNQTQVRGDCKIELDVELPLSDVIEVSIGGHREVLKHYWLLPPGYWAKIGTGEAKIGAFPQQSESRKVVSTGGILQPLQRQKLRIERIGSRIDVYIDDVLAARRDFIIPLSGQSGNEYHHIGFRAWQGTKVYGYSIERYTLPERTSPTETGDTLIRHNNFPGALKQYLQIAHDFPDSAIAQESLAKAYMVALELGDTDQQQQIEQRFTFNDSSYWSLVTQQAKALAHWSREEYDQGLQLAENVLAHDPRSPILIDLLGMERKKLPQSVKERCAQLLISHANGTSLNLSHLQLDELPHRLPPKLTELNLSHNNLKTLPPLSHTKLVNLNVDHNQITHVDSLADLNLEHLSMSHNHISDLTSLRDMPLQQLHAQHNTIADISVLRSLQDLKSLNLGYNQITNLDDLAARSLNSLNIRSKQGVELSSASQHDQPATIKHQL